MKEIDGFYLGNGKLCFGSPSIKIDHACNVGLVDVDCFGDFLLVFFR